MLVIGSMELFYVPFIAGGSHGYFDCYCLKMYVDESLECVQAQDQEIEEVVR